ncbi:addiction module antidote protein, HigA family [Candidatus Electrothrix marina]|uniref:Addiction module antidote protein, HigA family n=2 Tax=Candidatus Electrothrix marina TaxID=1859130 RepID=A0A3S3RWV5_9BACT|nr:addiction module antidote protein, HigA family [Candidatus Electrothrix marina]
MSSVFFKNCVPGEKREAEPELGAITVITLDVNHALRYEGSIMKKLKPVTPGEILLEEFLKPMGLSQYRLAKEINVPAQRINEIVAGRRSITADTDLRLCRFFSLSNGYWLRAQAACDTEVAEHKLKKTIMKITPFAGRQSV